MGSLSAVSVSRQRRLIGIPPAAAAAVIEQETAAAAERVWFVLTESLRRAEQLAEDLRFFQASAGRSSGRAVLVFPERLEAHPDRQEAYAAESDRLAVLSRLRQLRNAASDPASETLIVCSTPAAVVQPVPSLEAFARRELTVTTGQTLPFGKLAEELQALDYDSESVCEAPGQYAVRGGIIDVFPVTAATPYRIDFFGDEVEAIRAFDPVTQRSGDSAQVISIAAAPGVALPPATRGLAEYFNGGAGFLLVEPGRLEETLFLPDEPEVARALVPLLRSGRRCVAISELDLPGTLLDAEAPAEWWNGEPLAAYRAFAERHSVGEERLLLDEEARRRFLEQVVTWKRAGYYVAFVLSKEAEEQRAREILSETPALRALRPRFARGPLNEGFRLEFTVEARLSWKGLPAEAAGLVVVTETELFGRQRQRRPGVSRRAHVARSQVDQLLDFSELVEGDYVVHLQHGIAHYRGITKVESQGQTREMIALEFEQRVMLYVPLQESHLLSRYVGLSKARPQLGRIGSNRWEKIRQAAERATLDFAAELLQRQARRDLQPGQPFAADSAWQKEFEAAFPFTETPDQRQAIEETKEDMERTRPMDRLICGDVGFGKTEVAIRAAFKAVMDGRQVAVLVPTTVLAQQHLNTFRDRMAGYPVSIEMVSRFRTRKEQQQILQATAAGKIDILIGTHRLIQSDVRFKNLGLVVIDEEQRFGVRHKEMFKRWRENIYVLSMSATPIPRTLYMALTGARDLSVIETPPANRHPIQTIVRSYDEKLVVDAIRHEVKRGGQVFYLHNRVQTIDEVAQRLQALLPDVNIAVGHGQMSEHALERIMTDFVAGRYQVLVCTTIIESGLDIPNCNTIIIEGADRFGLSQLYQLRGRVGRFRHQAYAYLLLHRHTHLLDIARQRLAAIRQHTHPGAGFRIAMRDLELRGAGNLLGSQQSGHIVGVGFELYCQLLRQSIARLKGEDSAATVRASVKLDFVFVGEGEESGRRAYEDGYTVLKQEELGQGECPKIQARIPPSYVGETRLRIDFYRRLAMADSVATVRQISAELEDRFGSPPDEVRALVRVTEIRCRAEHVGIVSVETEGNRLKCLRNSGRSDDYLQFGTRFPRLTACQPLLRLEEISVFLQTRIHS